MEKATLGAGCFWGVEAAFRQVKGVKSTSVGYMGGWLKNPTYPEVCSGQTGHTEVVEVEYDPSEVSYDQLLQAFWDIHDTTIGNRKSPDRSTQYKSVIFFHDAEQEAAAKASKEKLQSSGRFDRNVLTEMMPASQFYRAEDYHQQYLEKNRQGSSR